MRPIPCLTPDLARLAARLLTAASESFANHGCNDFNLTKIPGFEAKESRAALHLAMCAWEGAPERHDPEHDHRYVEDFVLMSFLAAVIEKTAGEVTEKSDEERRVVEVQRATLAAQDAAILAATAVRGYQAAKADAEAQIGRLRAELDALTRVIT